MTLKALHHDTVQRAEVVQIILHEIILQLLKGQLHKAPLISPPQRILDVGTCIGLGHRYGGQKVPFRGGTWH
jgi:hypothetical protein